MPAKRHYIPVPHFLGIGAQKSATTWLYRRFNGHPEIYVPIKEAHYFNRRSQLMTATEKERSLNHRLNRLLAFDRLPGQPVKSMLENALTIPRERLKLLLNFHFGMQDDQWYQSLFDHGRGRCCGEITPAYSVLTPDEIHSIYALNPKCKIIFLMRNPVEREWSSYKFWYRWGKKPDWTGSLDQLEEHVSRPGVQLRSDYLRTIQNWQGVFGTEQVFLGFFEDVKSQPRALLCDIAKFLGVGDRWAVDTKGFREKINKTPDRPMSQEIQRFLYRRHLRQIELLASQFGGHAQSWLQEAHAILESSCKTAPLAQSLRERNEAA